MLNVKRLVRRESITRREPVFPGYLFIRLDENITDWRALNGTRGELKRPAVSGAAATDGCQATGGGLK